MTPLCKRMIDDMALRNLSSNTQANYIRAVAQFATRFRQLPDRLTRSTFASTCLTSSANV